MSLIKNIGIGRVVLNLGYNLDFDKYDDEVKMSKETVQKIIDRYTSLRLLPNGDDLIKAAIERFTSFIFNKVIAYHFDVSALDKAICISVEFIYETKYGETKKDSIVVANVFENYITVFFYWKDYIERLKTIGYQYVDEDPIWIKMIFV